MRGLDKSSFLFHFLDAFALSKKILFFLLVKKRKIFIDKEEKNIIEYEKGKLLQYLEVIQ